MAKRWCYPLYFGRPPLRIAVEAPYLRNSKLRGLYDPHIVAMIALSYVSLGLVFMFCVNPSFGKGWTRCSRARMQKKRKMPQLQKKNAGEADAAKAQNPDGKPADATKGSESAKDSAAPAPADGKPVAPVQPSATSLALANKLSFSGLV